MMRTPDSSHNKNSLAVDTCRNPGEECACTGRSKKWKELDGSNSEREFCKIAAFLLIHDADWIRFDSSM